LELDDFQGAMKALLDEGVMSQPKQWDTIDYNNVDSKQEKGQANNKVAVDA
jgi:hypothetical protein